MRSRIKTAWFAILWLVDAGVRKLSRRPVVAVLMYHSIRVSPGWKYSVSPSDFSLHLDHISKWGDVVPLDHIVEYINGTRSFLRNSVAITVDDGYDDTYTAAYPALKERGFAATVFLTTDLSRMDKLGDFGRPTWDEVREMNESGLITFEVHGHRHVNLKQIDGDEKALSDEIKICRDEIKRQLGRDTGMVAYASGHRSGRVIEYVKRLGFVAGFGIQEGTIKQGADPFLIRRIQVDGTMPLLQFKSRLSGAVDLNRCILSSIRRIFRIIHGND